MITVHVICRNKAGEPDICTAHIEASAVMLRDGTHYDLAVDEAARRGYEVEHHICVDDRDHLFRRIVP